MSISSIKIQIEDTLLCNMKKVAGGGCDEYTYDIFENSNSLLALVQCNLMLVIIPLTNSDWQEQIRKVLNI